MNNIVISVIMPAYNAEKTIKKSVQSILNQTFTDFEFIIINDGSTDATLEIINSFDDDRITLIDKTKNQGLISALNDGIKQAKGDYIARMDADDESLPDRLAMQINFFNKKPDTDVLGTAIYISNNKNKKILRLPATHNECMKRLVSSICIFHPTVMLKKVLVDKTPYNLKYKYAEDYKLWVDLVKQGAKFANLQTPLLNYYIHNNNVSIKNKNEQVKISNSISKECMEFHLGNKLSNKYHQQLDFIAGYDKNSMSLKSLSNFYNSINQIGKNYIMHTVFRRAIKNNIHLINYNFEFVNLKVLTYYLRYKIKNLFKKL